MLWHQDLVKVPLVKRYLFPSRFQQTGSLRNGISQRKARKIWRSLLERLLQERFPLDWSLLSEVEFRGELDGSIEADLSFGEFTVRIASVYVGDNAEILQFGLGYGSLVY